MRTRTSSVDRKKNSIGPHIVENVDTGATIHTDEFVARAGTE